MERLLVLNTMVIVVAITAISSFVIPSNEMSSSDTITEPYRSNHWSHL
ncbi:MAG: spore germination protein [Bacillota bacterium]